jgi:ComF family protein
MNFIFLKEFLKKIKKILHIFFPDYCIVCKNILEHDEHKICDVCVGKISEIGNFCNKCGSPSILMQDWCINCGYKKVYYEKLFALYHYDDTIRFLLKQIKYRPSDKTFENLEFFYDFFNTESVVLEEFEKLVPNLDFMIPVPIHHLREQKRGYNQSLLFCDILSDIFALPVNDKIIKKTKNTHFFFNLGKKERAEALDDAFEILQKSKDLVRGKNILLVDDISTTGVTFNQISKILLEHGANTIFCFCVAHD